MDAQSLLLLAVLFSAVAIGWVMGRGARNESDTEGQASSYIEGLNYLLKEQPDEAIDAFLEALEINDSTVEVHFILGQLLRKQGQPDRAIRVHQNLIARPGIDRSAQNRAKFELALDFMQSGLYDRASRIFSEQVSNKTEHATASAEKLLDIHIVERDWDAALEVIRTIKTRRITLEGRYRNLKRVMAHLLCEKADLSIQSQRFDSAEELLKKARRADGDCPRVLYGRIQLNQKRGDLSAAKRDVRLLLEIDPHRHAHYLEFARELYNLDHDINGLAEMLKHRIEGGSKNLLDRVLLAKTLFQLKGHSTHEADDLINELIEQSNSLGAADLYIDRLRVANPKLSPSLGKLAKLVQARIAKKSKFRCTQCGFTGQQLHWVCPSCKEWESVVSNDESGVS